MAILICAATRTEVQACTEGIKRAGLEDSFEILETGVGLTNSMRAIEARLRGTRPELIVSTGFAGAYSPGLGLHAWITSDRVLLCGTRVESTYDATPLRVPGVVSCSLVTSADLVVEHAQLRERYEGIPSPVAVDMESAIFAEAAAARNIPFSVFRLITDTPLNPLPSFVSPFAAAMATQSWVDKVRLGARGVRSMLREPQGVVRLVKEGSSWATLLSDGWHKHANGIRQEFSNRAG